MPDPKGDILYVKLAASQARRRLKGFGHGVRKVQSAGRDRAAIIHTATGHHLAELEAKFADVGFAHRAADLEPKWPVDVNELPAIVDGTSLGAAHDAGQVEDD